MKRLLALLLLVPTLAFAQGKKEGWKRSNRV